MPCFCPSLLHQYLKTCFSPQIDVALGAVHNVEMHQVMNSICLHAKRLNRCYDWALSLHFAQSLISHFLLLPCKFSLHGDQPHTLTLMMHCKCLCM